MAESLQLFLSEDRPEAAVLAALGVALGFEVETLDLPSASAVGFVQESLHPEGFPKGLLVSWPAGERPARVAGEVALALAQGLRVQVLLEGPDDDHWRLFAEDGTSRPVGVTFLADGVRPI